MTDNVRFNPFTGQAFSSGEIKKLDTNNDGAISSDELWSNINFVSGYQEQDTEGEVQIGDNFENSDKSKEESAIKTFGKGSLSIAEGVVDPALGV